MDATVNNAQQEAEKAMRRRDWAEAIKCLKMVLDNLGEQTPREVYLKLSKACRNQFDFETAYAVVQQALARHPDDGMLASDLVQTAIAQQDWPEAVSRGQAVLEKFGSLTPPNVYRLLSIGHRSHRKHRDFAAAEAIIRQGMTRYPDDFELAGELAEIAMKQEDWPEAIRRWQDVIKNFKSCPGAFARLSVAHRSAGDLDAAESIIHQGMAKHPGDAKLAMEMANLAMAREDWKEAHRRLKTFLAEFGESIAVYRNLSIVLHHQGDFTGADVALQKGLDLEYAQPTHRKRPVERELKRVAWEQSYDPTLNAAECRIKNLRAYVKVRAEPGVKVFSGYHAIEINGTVIAGKRRARDRLKLMPYDLTNKSALDIGCNQGGVLFDSEHQLRWGVGIDYDTKVINVANRIRSEKGSRNIDFYSFDLDRDPLPLIRDLMREPKVDIVFLLAVCAHIKSWREVIDFCANISQNMLFEAHGHEWLQLGQMRRVRSRYKRVELVGEKGSGDPSMRTRKLYFCSQV